jgi:hypothetical protein
MRTPDWFELVLLGLAAFRVWKLIGEDTILDTPRAWTLKRAFNLGGPKAKDYVETLLECPWCAGFWVSLGWWGAWEAWPHGSLIAAAPFAISALVGTLAHFTSE